MAGRPPLPSPSEEPQQPDGERQRLVAAISKTAAEHGYAGLSVEKIVDSAELDRDVFDAHFGSRDEGLVAAQELFIQHLLFDAVHACEREGSWPMRLARGLRAVLAGLGERAELARVFVVEADAAARLMLAEQQLTALDEFAALLRLGRQDWPAAAELPKLTERALVGGIASLINQRLLREEPAATRSFEAEVTELMLIPYVGGREARRIALEL